ncbi:MAG: hypothetical protein RLZZ14_513 [Actinomycetota bacterium]
MEPILNVIPAIDIKGARAVRLKQGMKNHVTDYGDPVERAYEFQRAGAEWLHVVDLDAAFGEGSNWKIVESIVKQIDIKVEVSGGIRDDRSLDRALSSGSHRVTIGTAAMENPAWIAEKFEDLAEKIIVALDIRDGRVATRGWTEETVPYREAIKRLDGAGCLRYMVTDISKDGTLTGPNLSLLEDVASNTESFVIASGGVALLEDIASLRHLVTLGIEGAVIGKALYEGVFTLAEAIEVAERG